MADGPVTTISDDKEPEIVLPTEIEKVKPKQLPKEKEKQIEVVNATPIVSSSNLKIGQKHQGGIIFYLDNSGKHGRVCTERDLGRFNWDSAMEKCQNLNLKGYSDWYLPSSDELKLLYNQKHVIPCLSVADYWSSFSFTNLKSYKFSVYLTNGNSTCNNKDYVTTVRGVRAF